MVDGLYQSVICFYFPYLLYYQARDIIEGGNGINSYVEIGVFVSGIAVTVVNLYILMNQQRWDWLFSLIIVISILLWWTWTGNDCLL